MSFFVTGTDTGVGKTHFTRLFLQTLRAKNLTAAGYKPIACGDRDDAVALAEASGGLSLDEVNPIHLKTPVAPHVAAILENQTIHPESLLSGFQKLSATHQHVVVEGVGGWEVPILADYHVSDLAKDLGLPVILVAANRLGALNHILLTANAIRAKDLHCAGLILNQLEDEFDTAMITNRGIIEEISGLPILAHLIHGQDFLEPDFLENLSL